MQRGIVLTSLSTVIALALGLVLGAHLPHQAAPPSDSGLRWYFRQRRRDHRFRQLAKRIKLRRVAQPHAVFLIQ